MVWVMERARLQSNAARGMSVRHCRVPWLVTFKVGAQLSALFGAVWRWADAQAPKKSFNVLGFEPASVGFLHPLDRGSFLSLYDDKNPLTRTERVSRMLAIRDD
jgi:hypothetical protein